MPILYNRRQSPGRLVAVLLATAAPTMAWAENSAEAETTPDIPAVEVRNGNMSGNIETLASGTAIRADASLDDSPVDTDKSPTAHETYGPVDRDGPVYRPEFVDGAPQDMAARMTMPVASFSVALQRAYWNSPGLLAQRSRLKSTDYRLPAARAAFGPNVELQASYGFRRGNTEDAVTGWSAREGWASTASAIVSQPFLTFVRLASNERTALAEIEFQRIVLRSVEQETIFNVVQAYVTLLRDMQTVSNYAEDAALLERELRDNSGRYARREVTISDLRQVETRVKQSQAFLMIARQALASSEANFVSIIGGQVGDLQPFHALPMPVTSLEEAYTHAERHSPLILAAYAREKISRAAANAARSNLMPRVDLQGRADYGTVNPYSDDLRQTSLSGQVTLSGALFDNGVRRARSREAVAANDADWRLIDQAMRENRAEVAGAWNAWLAQTASIEPLGVAVQSAREAYDGAVLQEKAGLRSTLDVLSLARELLTARNSYVGAIVNSHISQARLLAAIGALEYSLLAPGMSRYDPEGHFNNMRGAGTLPLIPSLLMAGDALFTGGSSLRPIRDAAGAARSGGVALPVPLPAPLESPSS